MTAPRIENPATVDTVAGHLGLMSDDPERDHLAGIVAAVNALVSAWKGPAPVAGWPPQIVEGATMYAARLHRRRNSPAGVESFGELGPVYVQRNDPDVAMLLGLGNYLPPRVG